jgi:hypothetical protein
MMTGRSCPPLSTTPDLLCGIAADCFDSSGMAIHLGGEKMSSSFKQVTVLGAGVLGAQISFQIAYSGF